MGGLQLQPLPPGSDKSAALKAPLIALFIPHSATKDLIHPALKGLLLGDGHLALHLEHLA